MYAYEHLLDIEISVELETYMGLSSVFEDDLDLMKYESQQDFDSTNSSVVMDLWCLDNHGSTDTHGAT